VAEHDTSQRTHHLFLKISIPLPRKQMLKLASRLILKKNLIVATLIVYPYLESSKRRTRPILMVVYARNREQRPLQRRIEIWSAPTKMES
jgi:hypothetical protein